MAIPKRRANNGKGSRHGHCCPSPRDKELPPVQGAKRTKRLGRGRKSDGVTEIFRCHPDLHIICIPFAPPLYYDYMEIKNRRIEEELTSLSDSTSTWSYSLSATRNMIDVTFSKQWIHFRRSDL